MNSSYGSLSVQNKEKKTGGTMTSLKGGKKGGRRKKKGLPKWERVTGINPTRSEGRERRPGFSECSPFAHMSASKEEKRETMLPPKKRRREPHIRANNKRTSGGKSWKNCSFFKQADFRKGKEKRERRSIMAAKKKERGNAAKEKRTEEWKSHRAYSPLRNRGAGFFKSSGRGREKPVQSQPTENNKILPHRKLARRRRKPEGAKGGRKRKGK